MQLAETEEALGLLNVPNLRDVAAVAPHIVRSRVLFRGSEMVTEAALEQLGVKTLVDLREKHQKPVVSEKVATRVLIPMVDREAGAALIRGMPTWFKVRLFCCAPCLGLREPIGNYIFSSDDTLLDFFWALFQHGTTPIRQVFEQLASRESYPILIHCVAGKDRTGVITALVLSLLGVDRATICADFAASEGFLRIAFERSGRESLVDGESLLTEHTIRSPAIIMETCLARVENEYGSVQNYLTSHVQIPQSQLDIVRTALSVSQR